MGVLARVGVAFTVSCVLGAGLWAGLRSGADLGFDASATFVGVLEAVLSTLSAAWVAAGSTSTAESPRGRGKGSLKGADKAFVDRRTELKAVKAKIRNARIHRHISAPIIIYGMPGAGKSEFAVHAAHKLVNRFYWHARRARLTMRAEYVELHGLEGERRVDARDALRGLFGKEANSNLDKMNIDQLGGEWRRELRGTFLILVLDNVDDEDQVIPFLPGDSEYILLATARRVPQGVLHRGLDPYPLGVLDERGAHQMIGKAAGRHVRRSDQAAVEKIAKLCGRHPLAIRLAVSSLRKDTRVTFQGRQEELERDVPRLLPEIDKYASRAYIGVAKSFERSYTRLQADQKIALRRLGLVPLPHLRPEAVAALGDIAVADATAILKELEEEALINKSGQAEGQSAEPNKAKQALAKLKKIKRTPIVPEKDAYHIHDLVRHYGRLLASADGRTENEAAITRLLAYYHDGVAHADAILTRQPPPKAVETPAPSVRHRFPDGSSSIIWARTELPNLLACADYVVRAAEDPERLEEKRWVVRFATALAGFLRNEGMWPKSIELQTHALTSAQQLGLPLAEANALAELGILHRLVTNLDAAVGDLERAIALYRDIGGEQARIGESHALNTYGTVLDQLASKEEARRVEAKQALEDALVISRTLNYQLGEANVLHDQGMTELFAGNLDDAIHLFRQARDLFQAVDQRLGMGHANSNLARALQRAGHEREAAECLDLARTIYRDELENRLGVMNTLIRLGEVHRRTDRRQALSDLNEAIKLSSEINNHIGHVNALDEQGEVYLANGDRKRARKSWTNALAVARERGITREVESIQAKIRNIG
jgi:tetratricopeptide (TPR) repeat protein